MKTVYRKGQNNRLIITLHGTGGSADSLFPLAERLDPQASLLGFQGKVMERGMARYFARDAQGRFDLESLDQASEELRQNLASFYEKHPEYQRQESSILGYSNGANLIQNLLKQEDFEMGKIFLFHPSSFRENIPFHKQSHIQLFLTYGENDPFIERKAFEHLVEALEDAKIQVEAFRHQKGHQLTEEELHKAKDFYEKTR